MTKQDRTPRSGTVLDGFKTKSQLAAELGITQRALELWIARGIGPRATKLGKFVLFTPRDIQAWLDSRRQPLKKTA